MFENQFRLLTAGNWRDLLTGDVELTNAFLRLYSPALQVENERVQTRALLRS
jgi:hypothetical protein